MNDLHTWSAGTWLNSPRAQKKTSQTSSDDKSIKRRNIASSRKKKRKCFIDKFDAGWHTFFRSLIYTRRVSAAYLQLDSSDFFLQNCERGKPFSTICNIRKFTLTTFSSSGAFQKWIIYMNHWIDFTYFEELVRFL